MELKTIKDLLDYKFKVPSYQRGYRWEETQVKALLDDILDFSNLEQGQGDDFYCLQPLIVKPLNVEKNINLSKIKEQADENGDIEYEKLQNLINQHQKDNTYNLIDGQQRLTTIYLILKYLDGKNFELHYERDNVVDDKFDGICYDSADKFYISTAIKTIKDWFNKHKENEADFKNTLLNSVKVIWYRLKENDDEKQAFENVNSGKIPLTNAELIKATLINSKQNEKDKIELAKEWDEIEYYLQNDEVWGFLTTAKAYPTRIELIFEICLNPKHNDSDKYKTFYELQKRYKPNNTNKNENDEKKKPYEDFWQEVKQTFLTLRYWYEDHEIYHLVGFLVATKFKVKDIYDKVKDKTKTKFREYLKTKIKEKIEIDRLEKLKYGENNADITNALLLFNIATILNSESDYTRFSFDKFNKEKWSLEHIHAQNVEEIRGSEKQKDFLDDTKRNLANQTIFSTFSEEERKTANDLTKEIDDFMKENTQTKYEKFVDLHKKIVNLFGGLNDDNKHNISNLALLSANLNAELNNAIFPSKQEKIKKMDERGEFIPICTKNAFMKYYSDSANNRFIWNINDALSYYQSMIKTLYKFLGDKNE